MRRWKTLISAFLLIFLLSCNETETDTPIPVSDDCQSIATTAQAAQDQLQGGDWIWQYTLIQTREGEQRQTPEQRGIEERLRFLTDGTGQYLEERQVIRSFTYRVQEEAEGVVLVQSDTNGSLRFLVEVCPESLLLKDLSSSLMSQAHYAR
ncbi:MAG: hypothetical protein ACFCUI_12020 [Bernardetiaceae bacterium]